MVLQLVLLFGVIVFASYLGTMLALREFFDTDGPEPQVGADDPLDTGDGSTGDD